MSANFNFNKVILGGRLTADPEVKTSATGNPVVTVGVAVNRLGTVHFNIYKLEVGDA